MNDAFAIRVHGWGLRKLWLHWIKKKKKTGKKYK